MDHESLAFMIAVLRKHFVAYCTENLTELDVTYGQLFILIAVDKKPGCAPKEIAAYLKLDAGHLNRTLGKLIEKELITQKKNSNDRRANCSAPNNLDIRIIGGISIVKINPSTKAGNLRQKKSWLHHLSLVSGVRDQ